MSPMRMRMGNIQHKLKRTRKNKYSIQIMKNNYAQLCTHANLKKNEAVQLIYFLKRAQRETSENL